MLVGSFPIKGASDKELYQKIVSNEYQVPEWISPQAANLLKKVLEGDADKRPTAREVYSDPWL